MVEIPDSVALAIAARRRIPHEGRAEARRECSVEGDSAALTLKNLRIIALLDELDRFDPPPPKPTLVDRMLFAWDCRSSREHGMNRVLAVVREAVDSIEPDMRSLRRSDIDTLLKGN